MKLKTLFPLALLAGFLAPQLAHADETVTDWKGNKITLKEGEVNSHGVKIHYYTVGEGPLVFISHGNGGWWFDWRNQLAMLSKRYKVVLYDMRGFNKSDKVVGLENNVDAKFEEDLKTLQEHFTKGPAIHLGHDQGGMVLWCYAMNYPNKVRLLVQTNAIHPRAFVRDLAFSPEQQKASLYIQAMHDDPPKAYAREKNFVMNPDRPLAHADNPETHKMRVDAFNRTGDQGFQETVDWYRANFPKTPYSPDAAAFGSHGSDFPHIKAPTLNIHSLADTALMAGGTNQLGTWVDNEFSLITLPGATHWVMEEKPEQFNAILANWLDMHDPMQTRLSAR